MKEKIIDRAGDIINFDKGIKKFKILTFGILGYTPGKNDGEVVEFLNFYRQYLNSIGKK